MIKQDVIEFLSARRASPGESVEYGWFMFRIARGDEGLDLETLDFEKMASYTRDFSVVERIKAQQFRTLNLAGTEPLWCNLCQFATVSRAYSAGHPAALMHRADDPMQNSSGWYLGTADASTFAEQHDPVSLYELSISDRRLLPFWLLPLGYSVLFERDTPRVMDVDESGSFMKALGIEE